MNFNSENFNVLKPFFRGLPIIVLVVFLSVWVSKRYVKYATPMFETNAKIKLADNKDGASSTTLYKDLDLFANANRILAEVEVLKSKAILERALDSLNFSVTTYRIGQIRKIELYNECPFIVFHYFSNPKNIDNIFNLSILSKEKYSLQNKNDNKIFNGIFGEKLFVNNDSLIIYRNEVLLQNKPNIAFEGNYEFIINSKASLLNDINSKLEITPLDKETPIIKINFKSPIAQKAADFVNKVAKAYVDDYIETKTKSANITVKFLNKQLEDVGEKLSESENEIEGYKNKKHIINIKQETETNLRKISDLKVQQTNVRMNLEAINELNNYMKNGSENPTELAPNFEAYTDLLATEMVKKMKLLQSEKKDLLLKYTLEHEQVKAIDSKISDISKYLSEGINNTRKSLQTKYNRISEDINEAEQSFIGLPDKEKNMGVLGRNFNLNEQTYNFLHEKRTEAELQRAATISFHRIISSADVPLEPISPNKNMLKFLSAFLGFLFLIFAIYLIHALKAKVNDKTTIEKNSIIPIAASLPYLKTKTDLERAFHKLAIELDMKNILNKNSIITISSFAKNEGKNFCAKYLAQELANQNKNVLLAYVDEGENVTNLNNEKPTYSILDLQKEKSFFVNKDFVIQKFLKWKSEFDYVLIKNECINNSLNGLMMMKLVDSNIFMMDSRITSANMIGKVSLMQEEYSFPNFNFILNREGYNPNIFSVAKLFINKHFKKNEI